MATLAFSPVCTIFKTAKVQAPKKRVTPPLKSLETLGGRLAMQGSLWGGISKVMLDETLADQVRDPHCMMTVAAVTSLVTLGTLITNRNIGDESYYSFTPEAEVINGRVAMMGILAATVLNL
jgi:hypothetical protein